MIENKLMREWKAPELTVLSVNRDTGLGLLLGDDLIIIGTAS